MYTITSDTTLRIFLPVLDAPQRLQLHASLDLFTAAPSSSLVNVTGKLDQCSNVFWLDRDTISDSLAAVLSQKTDKQDEDTRYRRIQEMNDEKWDFFVRILQDGSLLLRAVTVRDLNSFNHAKDLNVE